MFKNNLAVALKCNGKILREEKNIVYIPFNEEYSIYFKNLHCKRAKINVSIDGEDVLNGRSLILNGNSELNLERFVDDLTEGNRFKFIPKTEKIKNYRGDKIDDGIIRIEFVYEKQSKQMFIKKIPNLEIPDICYDPPRYPINPWNNIYYKSLSNIECNDFTTSENFNNISSTISNFSNEEGITTLGSISNQKFEQGTFGLEEDEKYVITFQLKGYNSSGEIINEPFTTKTPKICKICGTKNKNTNKYCHECGTYLK